MMMSISGSIFPVFLTLREIDSNKRAHRLAGNKLGKNHLQPFLGVGLDHRYSFALVELLERLFFSANSQLLQLFTFYCKPATLGLFTFKRT